MVQITSITAAAAAVWLAAPATAMYPKSSPVLQVDAKNYQSLIAKSNHTSVLLHQTHVFYKANTPYR